MPDNNSFVIAAYVVMWVGVLGYLVRLHRVARDARQRLEEASRPDAGRDA